MPYHPQESEAFAFIKIDSFLQYVCTQIFKNEEAEVGITGRGCNFF
jgi:hypothetical protein